MISVIRMILWAIPVYPYNNNHEIISITCKRLNTQKSGDLLRMIAIINQSTIIFSNNDDNDILGMNLLLSAPAVKKVQ